MQRERDGKIFSLLGPIVLSSRPFSLGDLCDLGYAMPQVRLKLHITERTDPNGPSLGATSPRTSSSALEL